MSCTSSPHGPRCWLAPYSSRSHDAQTPTSTLQAMPDERAAPGGVMAPARGGFLSAASPRSRRGRKPERRNDRERRHHLPKKSVSWDDHVQQAPTPQYPTQSQSPPDQKPQDIMREDQVASPPATRLSVRQAAARNLERCRTGGIHYSRSYSKTSSMGTSSTANSSVGASSMGASSMGTSSVGTRSTGTSSMGASSVATSSSSSRTRTRARVQPRGSKASSSSSTRKRPRSPANHLGGFVLHAVTPCESTTLHYTSLVPAGTHTEYELVLEDACASTRGESWVVSRRYSAFRSLRDEAARIFECQRHPGAVTASESNQAHCTHCAPMLSALRVLSDKHFPRRRLWGSKRPKVVQKRAKQFVRYLRGLLALATDPSTRRCPLVTLGFAVQLRTFLTMDSVPYMALPGQVSAAGVPFLLHEMSLMASQSGASGTPLMTIDELDAATAQSLAEDDEGFLERFLDGEAAALDSLSDFPSPVFVLEQEEDVAWESELDSWRGAGRPGRGLDR